MSDLIAHKPPDNRLPGHIEGLRLTRRAWKALE